jgi:tetratricopeptide (TPR) repeat protein
MPFNKLLWAWLLTVLLDFSPTVDRAQTPHSNASSEMEREFQAAMAAEDSGNLQQAEAILAKLHAAHPGLFAVNESLGLLYAQQGNASRALPLLEAAVREQPASDAAHANLGAALYSLHRNQPALIEFERAVRIDPGNLSAQQSLGRLQMENHQPAEAAKAFMAALRLKPSDLDLQLDCITALLAADRLSEAQQMLSTFPDAENSARAQSLLAEADEKQENFPSAGKHLSRALAIEPSEENAWQLSLELLRHWTFDAAVIELRAASAKFPDSKRMRLGLGAAYFGAAQYQQAIPVFADLLESEPDNSMYADLLGISCNVVMSEARPRCSALVHYAETHPKDAKAAAHAVALLLEQSSTQIQRPLAQKLLITALAADPKLPEAQFQMGRFLQDNSQWKESIPYLERAVELKPDYATAHYRLARAYWNTGRKQDGQAQMELQQKYSKQEQEDLDRRLRQITTFLVDVH